MEKETSIYPLIIMDYYPLRIDMNENKNSIFMCNNIQEVEKIITAYHKEMGNLVRNITVTPNKKEFNFQTADMYYKEIEESDWDNETINFETLKIFKE